MRERLREVPYRVGACAHRAPWLEETYARGAIQQCQTACGCATEGMMRILSSPIACSSETTSTAWRQSCHSLNSRAFAFSTAPRDLSGDVWLAAPKSRFRWPHMSRAPPVPPIRRQARKQTARSFQISLPLAGHWYRSCCSDGGSGSGPRWARCLQVETYLWPSGFGTRSL